MPAFRLWLPIVGALLICATAEAAEPVRNSITWPEALVAAEAASPRLRAAQAATEAAAADARAAARPATPTLQADLLTSDERTIDVEAELVAILHDPARGPAAAAARATWRAAEAALEAARAEVLVAVARAWWQAHAAQAAVAAAEHDLGLATDLHAAAVRGRDLGERPGFDVLRAEVELGHVAQEVASARAAEAQAQGALALRLGRAPDEPLAAAPSALPAPALDLAVLLAAAEARPVLAVARAQVDAAQADLAAARATGRPLVQASAFREDQEHGLRVGIQVPLGDLGQRAGGVAAARARLALREAELADHEREVRGDLQHAWLAARAAEAGRADYGARVLAPVERLVALVQQGYAAGELSLLEVLDAKRELAEARRTALDLDNAWLEALAQLQAASGLDLFGQAAGDDE